MSELSRRLAEWAADEQASVAAAERSRERWLRRQAAESATLLGALVDAAESGLPVVIALRGGAGLCSGTVTSVGADFVVMDRTLVPAWSIAAVRDAAAGDREPDGLTFVAALSRLADEDRPSVHVVLDGGETVAGDMTAVSEELVSLTTMLVSLDAVRALRLV